MDALLIGAVALFGDFEEKTLPMGIQTTYDWALNKGRFDAAELSERAVQGYYWSGILDNRICSLCFYLDGQFISSSSPYYGVLLPAIHFGDRCVVVPAYKGETIPEDAILKSIPDDLQDLAGLVQLFKKEKDEN